MGGGIARVHRQTGARLADVEGRLCRGRTERGGNSARMEIGAIDQ
jgi:hypothetical protein